MKSQKVAAIVFASLLMLVLAGCGEPAAKMALNISPQSQTLYKVTTLMAKDYEFDQPSVNKTLKKHTSTKTQVTFNQTVTGIDKNGAAQANITIKALKVLSTDPKGTLINFDSTRPKDKANPLSRFIGKTYKIAISKNGKVVVKNNSAVSGLVKRGIDRGVANVLFSKKGIQKRHQVLALMNAKNGPVKKGYKWDTLAASPRESLKPKSYDKVYTVESIKTQGPDRIATITMNALPSSKRAADVPANSTGMSFMAGMFDEQESYTGKMVLNLTTGQINKYNEKLNVKWTAAEQSDSKADNKGPDQLIMGFIKSYSIEKLD